MRLNWMIVALAGLLILPMTFLVYAGKASSEVLVGMVVTLGAWLAPSPVQRPTTETHNETVVQKAEHVTVKSDPPPPPAWIVRNEEKP